MKTKRLKKLMMSMSLSHNQVNYMVEAQRAEGAKDVSNALYYVNVKRGIQNLGPELRPFLRSIVLGDTVGDGE